MPYHRILAHLIAGAERGASKKGDSMQIVLSDPKAGKAYAKKTEKPEFLGKKMGEEIQLDHIGLAGFKGKITGGSDKDGFPMYPSLLGTLRRKILISKGVGFRHARKGEKQRRTVRGNTVGEDIAQLNVRLTAHGNLELLEALAAAGKEKEGEEAKK